MSKTSNDNREQELAMVRNNVKIQLFNSFNLKVIVVAFVVISTNLFPQGWQWQNPLPQGNPISSLQYLNKDVVWASVSGGGTLLKSTDGGETWEIFVLPESFHVNNVFFINDDVGWACGENYVFGTTDGGKNWETQLYDSAITFYTIAFANEKLGWITGGGSKIYHTTDGGENWNLQAEFHGYSNSFALVDSLHIWAVNTDGPVGSVGGALFYTKDGGKNWITDSTISWGYNVQFIDSLNGWICGKDKIANTTDGGKTWNVQSNLSGKWISISIPDKKHAFAITSSNIAVTSNGGETWTLKNNLSGYSLNTMSFYDSLNGLAAGWGGAIVKTTDGGINWELITKSITASNAELWDIFFIDDSTGWACGGEGIYSNVGIILKTTNGGNSWTKIFNINDTGPLRSIYFIDALNGFAAGGDSTIFKTTNGGLSWSSINEGVGYWNDIDFVNYPTGWIIGGSAGEIGKLLKTTNGGNTWNEDTSISFSTSTPGIHFTSKEIGWVEVGDLEASTIQQLYKTIDGGATWNLIKWNNPDTAYYSWQFISDKIGWIATSPLFGQPVILHTIDGGESWRSYPVPGYFNSISFVDSLTGWGTNLGDMDMYKTTDGGKTWTPQRAFSIFLEKVKFTNNNYGFAIGGIGAILNTTTGGVTSVKEETKFIIPNNFILYQNYPNPFNPSTVISYQLSVASDVKLNIYDILGRKITTLIDKTIPAGKHEIKFDASKYNLSSGVYFYQIKVGTFITTQKMVLLK